MKTLIGAKIKYYNKLLKEYPCVKPVTVFNILQGYINSARDYKCISFKEYTHYIRYIHRKYLKGGDNKCIKQNI